MNFSRNLVVSLTGLILFGCTTDRVTTEFEGLNTLLAQTSIEVTPKLKPGLEADRQLGITAAAEAGDPWFLSDDCALVLSGDTAVPATSCRVEKIRFGGRALVIGEATAAKRKLDTLNAYVAALELLMDSSLEQDVVSAYSLAVGSFGELGTAADSATLIDFIAKRNADKEKVEAAVSAGIAALRYNRMRSVVLKSNTDVRTVARELQLHLINLGVDKGFETRSDNLRKLNERVLSADTSDSVSYRALLVELEAKHAEFMKYYVTTSIYSVGMVARVHNTLSDAMRGNGSPDDVLTYLESLKSLADKLEA